MKRQLARALIGAVATLLLFAWPAWAAPAVAPPDPPKPPAESYTSKYTYTYKPGDWSVNVYCAQGGQGEMVSIAGDQVHVVHGTTTPDGVFHYTYHIRSDGLVGTGEVSGDTYKVRFADGGTYFDAVGPSFDVSVVNNFHIIGKGPGNNLLIHQVLRTTYDDNGVLTVTQDHFWSECR